MAKDKLDKIEAIKALVRAAERTEKWLRLGNCTDSVPLHCQDLSEGLAAFWEAHPEGEGY